MSKLTGAFYTPVPLAEFICSHINDLFQKRRINVLEPSCGEGVFLDSIMKKTMKKKVSITTIDINKEVIKKIKSRKYGRNVKIFTKNIDFLQYKASSCFDLVIGNPPYIGKRNLSSEQLELCQQIHKETKLSDRKINNIWTSFLIKSTSLLTEDGILAFVLPGELLQVKYANEIQEFLLNKYEYLEIYTFNENIFPEIGQEIIVLFAYKKSNKSGVAFSHTNNIPTTNNVKKSVISNNTLLTKYKWSNFLISSEKLEMVSNIFSDSHQISDFCNTKPGIVTAANDFFILNIDKLTELGVEEYCRPIIRKSEYIHDSIEIDQVLFDKIQSSKKSCFFLDVGAISKDEMNPELLNYIEYGEKEKIHLRYKCKQRDPWYRVPIVQSSPGVVFKRCHYYPKLAKTNIDTLFTDTAYNIFPNEERNINSIIFSFYNPMTLLAAELFGRFYGDGVLELTPNEFRKLPMRYIEITDSKYSEFIEMFAENSIIEYLTKNADLLIRDFEFTKNVYFEMLELYKKFIDRRLKKYTQKI